LGVIPPRASRLQSLLQRTNRGYYPPVDDSDSPTTATNSSAPTTRTTTDLLAESYQSLSATLALGKKKSPRTILLTSPRSGEGKTTTAINLAITLAWSGYKVALVDADLRTGRCHTLLHRERSPGLSEILIEGAVLSSSRRRPKKKDVEENHPGAEANSHESPAGENNNEPQSLTHAQKLKTLLETAVQPTTIEGLSFIACGQVWSDPEEQLASRTMHEVLSILRRQFDCVLIDSPAATIYGDAELLSQLTDATILVIRGHKTPMAAAHRIAGQLQAVHANVLGVVLTNISPLGTHAIGYPAH
jgi:Mrp family chromosome partitioning ATPase